MNTIKTSGPARSLQQISPFRKAFLLASLCLVFVAVSAFRMGNKPLVLTSTANGKTITVSSGNQVIIQLPDISGSTGYTWNFIMSGKQALTWQGATYLPPAHAMPGAPGIVVFTFLAHSIGNVQIHFQLQRSWEQKVPPAQRFTVTIQVQSSERKCYTKAQLLQSRTC